MKLTYWKIQCHDDSNIYSIRAKTKKEAIRVYKNMITNEDGTINESRANSFKEWGEKKAYVEKIVINYDDAFDLVDLMHQEYGADNWSEKKYVIK